MGRFGALPPLLRALQDFPDLTLTPPGVDFLLEPAVPLAGAASVPCLGWDDSPGSHLGCHALLVGHNPPPFVLPARFPVPRAL